MRIIAFLGSALAGAALVLWSAGADAANPRIALVIGESAYPDATLPTTANDAGLVAQVLQAAGFDVVGARDLDQKSVRDSLRDFLDKANAAGPDMQAFVYFSGRAFQYAGDNYLAPVDARISRASDAPIEAVKLSDFTHALAAAPGLARIVVIDGARANPYAQQGDPLAGGLALVDPEPNTVVAFNAAPGAIGVEDAGDYGVYAKTLSGLMRQGGVDVTEVLAETRIEVNQKTQGAQLPWSAGKFDAPYFLFERAPDAPPPVARHLPTKKPLKQLSAPEAYQVVIERDRLEDYEEFLRDHARSEQARRIEAILAARREALFWRRTLESNSPRAYWTYLKRYPHGPHAFDADRRLDAISARREPPRDFEVIEYEDLPPPPPREIVYADRPVYYFGGDDFGPPPPPPPREYVYDDDDRDWRDLPPPPRPTVAGMLPALAIAIPLGIAARAYYDRPRPDGRAPANAAPPPPRQPLAAPPLPRGVKAVERPQAAPPPRANPATPGAAGQVKFAPPPTAAAAGGRPPAPAPVVAPASASPTPTPSAGRPPQPAPAASPAPTPNGVRTPLPAPAASPAPTPGATRSPLPAPAASPTPAGVNPPAPAPSGARTPLPAPAASPAPTPATHSPPPAPAAPPTPARTPLPAPSPDPAGKSPPPKAPEAPLPKPAAEPPKPAAEPAKPKPVEAPKVEAPRPAPPPKAEPPKPEPPKPAAPAPHVEAPKPAAPAPHVEAPKPAAPVPHVEAPKAAAPAPHVEPPKAAAPAPHVEPPKPAAPAPHVEPPKAAAPAAACGHPGQPHC